MHQLDIFNTHQNHYDVCSVYKNTCKPNTKNDRAKNQVVRVRYHLDSFLDFLLIDANLIRSLA